MNILYTPKFAKQHSKLSSEVREIFENKESLFREDPFNSRLKTHKLNGKFSQYSAFSLNYKYRVVFRYTDDKKDVIFHSIGTHDIYE